MEDKAHRPVNSATIWIFLKLYCLKVGQIATRPVNIKRFVFALLFMAQFNYVAQIGRGFRVAVIPSLLSPKKAKVKLK